MPAHDPRAFLESLYAAALAAVEPGAAVARALEAEPLPPGRVHLLALGKAATPMARAALAALAAAPAAGSAQLAGGLVVAPAAADHPGDAAPAARPSPATLPVVWGDHPVPGSASLAAAAALAEAVAAIAPGDDVLVLLSGGASSLVGAPADGVAPDDYRALWELLLRSGLDIGAMNTVRKRVSRWGAGRLAAAARGAREIRVLVVSDVPGDALAAIGSGPCVPDAATAADVRAILERRDLWRATPASVRAVLEATRRDVRLETPKPGDAAFARVRHRVIANNRVALAGAAAAALRAGHEAELAPTPLAGEAREVGAALARELLAAPSGRCLLWGGETTVMLPAGAPPGGRCQELALAAARVLAEAAPERARGLVLLAAGTDGRDGPTDAAGAVVDPTTWRRIAAAGRDPAHALATHASHAALEAAHALLRPGPTGTNVMDVVLGARD
ncbi:MAG TPA: DUF4147 domain-containing protein [Gemmatimonadales bacterium]|nr:DUF4147 domain-containing protein [Gemmatimonadales bacterium]